MSLNRTHIPIPKPIKRKKSRRGLARKSRISPYSKKRAAQNKLYSELRKEFLDNHPYCQHWLAEHGTDESKVSSNGYVVIYEWRGGDDLDPVIYRVPFSWEIHHMKGRGKYLLDTSTWMAVSREGHRWIHNNPKMSMDRGYILKR